MLSRVSLMTRGAAQCSGRGDAADRQIGYARLLPEQNKFAVFNIFPEFLLLLNSVGSDNPNKPSVEQILPTSKFMQPHVRLHLLIHCMTFMQREAELLLDHFHLFIFT